MPSSQANGDPGPPGLQASRILMYATAGLAGIIVAFVLGFFFIVKPIATRAAPPETPPAAEQGTQRDRAGDEAASKRPVTKIPLPPRATAELTRDNTQVLVMNGSGARGAAQKMAARLQSRNYAIAGIANAPTQNYRRTLVLYKRGMRGEAERLARDLKVPRRRVSPIDGMQHAELQGASLVLILAR